jgi:hypothetical protein
MMFSRAFLRRRFGLQYRSWKRQDESRSVNSAELHAMRRFDCFIGREWSNDGLDRLSGKSEVQSALNHGHHQPCCTKCSTDTGQKYPTSEASPLSERPSTAV